MKGKQPLFHVVKREHVGRGQMVLAYVLAVIIAILSAVQFKLGNKDN